MRNCAEVPNASPSPISFEISTSAPSVARPSILYQQNPSSAFRNARRRHGFGSRFLLSKSHGEKGQEIGAFAQSYPSEGPSRVMHHLAQECPPQISRKLDSGAPSSRIDSLRLLCPAPGLCRSLFATPRRTQTPLISLVHSSIQLLFAIWMPVSAPWK